MDYKGYEAVFNYDEEAKIFFQKSGQGTWNMLPAMGFLWISIYSLVLGSGKIGIDYLLSKKFFK